MGSETIAGERRRKHPLFRTGIHPVAGCDSRPSLLPSSCWRDDDGDDGDPLCCRFSPGGLRTVVHCYAEIAPNLSEEATTYLRQEEEALGDLVPNMDTATPEGMGSSRQGAAGAGAGATQHGLQSKQAAWQQLAFQRAERTRRSGSEDLTKQARRAMAFLRAIAALERQVQFVGTRIHAGSAKSDKAAPSLANRRAVDMLRRARSAASSADILASLRALQFPSSLEKVNCADPSLQFLVFDGFFNLSSLPRVYSSEAAGVDSIFSLPLRDQCTLTGVFDLSSQVHDLARTLSVALLTGRTLVIPHVPNTLSTLLDLSLISPCTLSDISPELELVPISLLHQSITSEPLRAHRVGQLFLAKKGTTPADLLRTPLDGALSRDPFDASERVVRYSAQEYAFEWLLASSTTTPDSSSKDKTEAAVADSSQSHPFVSRALGVQEFISSLVGFLVQPNSAALKHVAATTGETAAADVGVLLPLKSRGTEQSAASLARLVAHQIGAWGLHASAVHPLTVHVSSSCSRSSLLHSLSNVNQGSDWGHEASRRGELIREDKLPEGERPERESMRLARQVREETMVHFTLQMEAQAQAVDAKQQQPGSRGLLRFISSRRHRSNVQVDDASHSGFSSAHEQLLAVILADVLAHVAARGSVSTHAHEEGLLVAELRRFACLTSISVAAAPASSSSAPALLPFEDLHGYRYLEGFQMTESLVRATAAHAALYEHEGEAAQRGGRIVTALRSAVFAAPGDPFLHSPPLLLSTPPSPILVRKTVRSKAGAIRFS